MSFTFNHPLVVFAVSLIAMWIAGRLGSW